MELDILHILSVKDNYDKYSYLLKDYMFSKEFNTIVKDIPEYYDKMSVSIINWVNFRTWFKFIKHKFTLEQYEIYDELFNRLEVHKVDLLTEELILKTLIDRDYAARIRSTALDIETEESSEYDILDIESLVKDYKDEIDKFNHEEEDFKIDILKLLEEDKLLVKYDWPISNLNQSVGPISKGNFIIVGARPDSGKTTFLCFSAVGFAKQFVSDDQCILWFNNEEPGPVVKKRIASSAIGMSYDKMMKDPLEAKSRLDACDPYQSINLIDGEIFSTKFVERMCKKYQPSIIIFDQLWKITGFNRESHTETERQTLLFAWARKMAKEYGPVIAVHQLGGDAEGEKWNSMRSLYGSQTGIQGEADAIINIGRSLDPKENEYRFFNIPKNKLTFGLPEYRNARFFLKILPEIARFEDVGEYSIS